MELVRTEVYGFRRFESVSVDLGLEVSGSYTLNSVGSRPINLCKSVACRSCGPYRSIILLVDNRLVLPFHFYF